MDTTAGTARQDPPDAPLAGRLPRLALVGPMLGRHRGWVVSQGEILAELFRQDGYPVHSTSSRLNPLLRALDTCVSLIRHRHRIDVVIVQVFSGRGFAAVDAASWTAARLLRRPLVCCLRGGNLPAFSRAHPRWVGRVAARAALLVAPSRYLVENLEGWQRPTVVIPNVLPLARYPFRPRRRLRPRLLWMRTFHDIYRPALALEVLARVRRRHPEATLTMAGQDAGLLAATRARAEALGLGGAVRFAGFLDFAAKSREFAAHDLFLNTNHIDNMPVSVVEAAAFGLPVVATAVGGIPYLLEHQQTALLVDDGDAEGMAQAVLRLLDEPDLAARLSARGRALAEASDWPQVERLWRAALLPLAGG